MRDNQLGMCASGLPSDCSNLVKVRLSDGSDGSIGKRVFRQTKNCRIEKLTSTTVVSTSVGNLTLASIDQSICSNSKLSLLKSECLYVSY